MSAIFLSYRRDDSSGYAGRMFDNLAERFGRERVFMDIETLEPGMDFVAGIDRAIDSCGAVIAMIGPNWIKAQDAEGRRRLDNPHDFIRLEITSALTRGVRVIPVLVHNASMPPEHDLPEPLRPLCRLQACEISDNRWEFDVTRLADVLEPLIAESKESPTAQPSATAAPAGVSGTATMPEQKSDGRPSRWLAAVAAVVVLVAAAGAWWLNQSTTSTEQASSQPVDEPAPPDITRRNEAVVTTVAQPEPHADPALIEPPPPDEVHLGGSPEPQPVTEAEPVPAPESPGPSEDELRQREIAELIHAAEIDLAELRLTRPAGNNAFERFQRVLELEPDNPAAHEGLIMIAERYHRLAEDALERGALDRAQRNLDSAKTVQPDTDWLTPLQREIDRRRQVAAQPSHQPERAPRPDAAERETCLADCENRHRACIEETSRQTEADCLRSHDEPCEQRYEACLSDPSKLYMGAVSHESECIGVHAKCRRSATKDCAAAAQNAEGHCATEFDTCSRHCQNLK